MNRNMQIIGLECPFVITKFLKHDEIKGNLLELINSTECETIKPDLELVELEKKLGPQDNVARLDWSKSSDFERPWVKYFMPYFVDTYTEICTKIGYNDIQIRDVWFQQYLKNGTHGWHTHSYNYSGVYYLEYPDGAPSTEFRPLSNEIYTLDDLKEGDFITFPSFLWHRAPEVLDVNRKTIISFNIDLK